LLVLLMLDNAVLVIVHIRRGQLNSRWLATLDVCAGMAALVAVVALLKPTANPDTDNILYPYTTVMLSVIGFAYRRLSASVIAATLAASVYVTVTAWRFGTVTSPSMLANATTYWAWGVAGWFVAAKFRELSTELDQAHQAAVNREAELARERERSRHTRELHTIRMTAALRELEQERARARLSRALHDHVLQTLEFMGRDDWISNLQVRDHVAAEAAWLRDLIHGELDQRAGNLSAALGLVAERQTRAGMQIELNTSGLGAGMFPEDVVAALAGAVTELLTNVRKHAGTQRAVIRAISVMGKVTVTVLDRGRGFDPIKVTGGLGLRESVIARVQEVDGHVVVTSELGVGTHVEITVPVPGPASRDDELSGDVPQKRDVLPG
jgi:signal transduction histidine kinase